MCVTVRSVIDLGALPAENRALIETQAAIVARPDAVAHRDAIGMMPLQLERLRRMQLGRLSEKLTAEIAQLTLALEKLEAGADREGEPADRAPADPAGASRETPRAAADSKSSARTTIAHETACACPQCGGALRRLGEDVTEVRHYVPALFRGHLLRAPGVLVPWLREHHPGAGAGDAGPPRSRLGWSAGPRACREVRQLSAAVSGRARSTSGPASTWSGPRWPTGSGSALGCCTHQSTPSARM